MDINNINNLKVTDSNIPKVNSNVPKSVFTEINNESLVINDNIDTNLNLSQLVSNELINELLKNQIDNKLNSNLVKEDKNLTNNKIPKNLTIFELDSINDNFLNKELKFNEIKAFGPTNLPNNPNEMFINPKYL